MTFVFLKLWEQTHFLAKNVVHLGKQQTHFNIYIYKISAKK